jgi:transcriptional regulator with XRE-family HTH domain
MAPEDSQRRGRRPQPVDPSASNAARLGADIRSLRQQRGLTLQQLARHIGYSTAHLGAVELAKAPASEQFVAACDRALSASGALLTLLPAAVYERASHRHRNDARRRWGSELPMPRQHAPARVYEPVTIEQPAHLDLSPHGPLATLLRERCPGARLSRPTPDFGIDWTLMLPDSSVIAVQVHPAATSLDGRILVNVRDVPRLREFLFVPHQALLLAVEENPEPRIYALDARAVRRQLADRPYADAILSIPPAYELDDLTYGVLCAASSLDGCLLADDLALAQHHRRLDSSQRLSTSDVAQEMAGDLTHVSRAWLGSTFCARHIVRNLGSLGELPTFWTREQRGEEASTWLLFAHKLAYLSATSRYFGQAPMVRVFCVPERAVQDSPPFQRILLFLAVALMEASGVRVEVCTEPEYSDVDGFVLAPRRALVATWVRTDSMWRVDTTVRRPILAQFTEASAHAAAHSAIARPTSAGRLAAFADYLEFDVAWLSRRCGQLASQGCGELVTPRSRLLAVAGVEAACASAGRVAANTP